MTEVDPLSKLGENLDTKFDPLCFARLSTDGTNIEEQFEVSELIAQMPNLDELTAAQIAHLFSHVKAQFELLDAARDELSKFVELIKNVKLPEAFDREKIKTFTLQDGTRITKSDRTFASIIGPQEDAFAWLEENGLGDLIKPTVNSSSLSSTAKGILGNVKIDEKTGMPKPIDPALPIDMPDDLFKVEIRPTTSVTRPKGKVQS